MFDLDLIIQTSSWMPLQRTRWYFYNDAFIITTPKSFRLKTPIKSRKAFNMMNVFKKKLIVIAKNNAKERMHKAALKVNELSQTLKAKVSEEHYLLIQYVPEKSRENKFIKKKEHLIYKFNEFQTRSSKRNNQQITTTYVKPSIINLTESH